MWVLWHPGQIGQWMSACDGKLWFFTSGIPKELTILVISSTVRFVRRDAIVCFLFAEQAPNNHAEFHPPSV